MHNIVLMIETRGWDNVNILLEPPDDYGFDIVKNSGDGGLQSFS